MLWPCSCSDWLHRQPTNHFHATNKPLHHHHPHANTNSRLHTAAIFRSDFQGIIALTNHPLGSGAHEIDVPSFQNNGGALWGASWCHNFSSWQARQVYFGPGMGTWPMKIQPGQLNQSLYRVRWQDCGVSSRRMLNHILCTEKTDSFYSENQASLSP